MPVGCALGAGQDHLLLARSKGPCRVVCVGVQLLFGLSNLGHQTWGPRSASWTLELDRSERISSVRVSVHERVIC
jgi:hypothetical protein